MAIAVERQDEELIGILVPVLADAEWLAAKTIAFLDHLKKCLGYRKRSFPIPIAAICELAAIIRIAMWQRDGVAVTLGTRFETAELLLERWLNRTFYVTKHDDDAASNDPELYAQVMRLWFDRCSWAAGPQLGRDVVLNRIDVDRLLDFWVRILGSK